MLRKLGSSSGLAVMAAVFGIGIMSALPTDSEAGSGTSCLPGALKSRLAEIRKKFGPVQVLSTYRAGARMPNGRTSFHASCRAVDFNPPRGQYSKVASWLKANHGGGVGTYSCGMHHIHIDNGPRVRFHHCQSASSGEEMDAAAVKAARANWPKAGAKGAWPVILPDKEPHS